MNPRRTHNQSPPTNSAAPRAPLTQQANAMLEMGEQIQAGIAPALEEYLDKQVFEARQEGRDFLPAIDLSALPGQTLGEQVAAPATQYVQTPLGSLPAELAEQLRQWAMDSKGPSVSANDAAQAGQSVAFMNTIHRTETLIAAEKRYRVMIQPKMHDKEILQVSINGVNFTIPLGVQVDLPYSLVSLMVDLGRLNPPPGCDELIPSAINAGAMNATAEMARLTSKQPGGYYHGDSPDAALAAQIDSMMQLQIQQQAGRALPAHLKQYAPPPALTMGGRPL